MSASPIVSVIMNCFNGEKYLREAIDSVLAQSFTDLEIIFWDNQSTDSTAAIIRSYSDPRIKYFLAPVKTPLGKARNLALEKASGQWIAYLDSDDVWLSTKLQYQLDVVSRQPSVGLVYARQRIIGGKYDGREWCARYINRPLPEGDVFAEYLTVENFIPLSAALIKRDNLVEVGGIPDGYFQAEDYYLFAAVLAKYSVGVVQSVEVLYRMHDQNLTLSQKVLNFDESLRVLSSFGHQLIAKKPQLASALAARRKELTIWRGLHKVHQRTDIFGGLKDIWNGGVIDAMQILCHAVSNRVRLRI